MKLLSDIWFWIGVFLDFVFPVAFITLTIVGSLVLLLLITEELRND